MKAVHEARQELAPYVTRLDWEALARHNAGYKRYAHDPMRYFIDVGITRFIGLLTTLAIPYPVMRT